MADATLFPSVWSLLHIIKIFKKSSWMCGCYMCISAWSVLQLLFESAECIGYVRRDCKVYSRNLKFYWLPVYVGLYWGLKRSINNWNMLQTPQYLKVIWSWKTKIVPIVGWVKLTFWRVATNKCVRSYYGNQSFPTINAWWLILWKLQCETEYVKYECNPLFISHCFAMVIEFL